MSTASKNAAIILAHYRTVTRACEAAGLTHPTFGKALRGEKVQHLTNIKLRRAAEKVVAMTAPFPRAMLEEPRKDATISELLSFREELLAFADRIRAHGSRSAVA